MVLTTVNYIYRTAAKERGGECRGGALSPHLPPHVRTTLVSRNLTDGRGRSPIDDFQVTWLQFNGCAIALDAATVDGLAPAFEKVGEAVSKACRNTGDDREQPCTIAFDKVGLVFDALDRTRDHSFLFVCKIFIADAQSLRLKLIVNAPPSHCVAKGAMTRPPDWLDCTDAFWTPKEPSERLLGMS